MYTRFLSSVDFSGVVFTHADFQKTAQISSLCYFYCISEGIPHALLVTNDLSAADLAMYFRFLSDLKQCMSQGRGVLTKFL